MSSIIEVVALALQRKVDNRYMIARRGPGGSGSGFWEFPGGKIETGETQPQALVREIFEEFSFQLETKDLQFIDHNIHEYSAKKISLYLWTCQLTTIPNMKLVDHDDIAWCSPSEMQAYNISPGDVYFISKLIS